MPHTRTEILSRIRETVTTLDPTAEVWLFGSRARGDAREDSDWDVLVLTDKNVDYNVEKQFIHEIYEVELDVEEAISVLVYNKLIWQEKYSVTPLFNNIRNEGMRLNYVV